MIQVDSSIVPRDLSSGVDAFFNLAGDKILRLAQTWNPAQGSPGLYRGRTLYLQGLDGLDPGIYVRQTLCTSLMPPEIRSFWIWAGRGPSTIWRPM